jgi:drug/metabolite transporter (DMT)-like permease
MTAAIWGFAFVAQRSGMDHVGPFLFNASRCALGAASVYAVIAWRERTWRPSPRRGRDGLHAGPLWANPTIRGGVWCGIALFAGSALQQLGLVWTSAGKAGFLTALYIVIVPFWGLFFGRRTAWTTWIAAAVAIGGLYLLCLTESFAIEPGNLAVLAGAFFWAAHILVTDHFVRVVDVFRMCCVQFAVAAALSAVASLAADRFFAPDPYALSGIGAALGAILFAGVISSGIGFTSQALAQRFVPPAVASIIMGLESVFAVIGGYLFLRESLTGRELVGCGLVFAAVLLAQAPVAASRGGRDR